ncbi:MAG: GDSL-type esterase/lipase family protein [Acidimicrobiales bacterium]
MLSLLGGLLAVVLVVALATVAVSSLAKGRVRVQRTPRPSARPTIPAASPPTTNPSVAQAATWRVAWGAAMAWGYGEASDTTVRQLAPVGVGGSAVRIRISNAFGNAPLVIGAATVALDASGATVVAGTMTAVTFGGSPGVTIPVGGVVTSDAVQLSVHALQTLAVSVFTPGTDLVSTNPSRPGGPVVSYFTPNGGGDVVSAPDGAAFPVPDSMALWVDSVDVLSSAGGSVVVVGDSITAGYHTALRWPHVLQQRIDLLPPDQRIAVVNESISANTLIDLPDDFARTGAGPAGLDRLAPDALTQPGVSEIVLFLGTNDLWFGATATQVITGLQQAIATVHKAGLKIIGVTLLPRTGSVVDGRPWTPTMEAYREQVNHWIRTSHAFDGVLDFASVVRDAYNGACYPTSLFPAYNSGDYLHPGPAGQTAMADSVDTTLLGIPAAPKVPLLVAATPTPGCVGPTG